MAGSNNTINTTVTIDATQAQQEIIKLNSIASDSTKTLEERIDAKNKQVEIQNRLSKQQINNAKALEKGLSGVKGKEKELEVAQKKLNKETLRATKAQAQNEKTLNKLNQSLERSKTKTSLFSKQMRMLTVAMLGSYGLVAAARAVIQAFKDAFNTFVDFERQNAVLAGVLDVTVNSTKELTDQAIRLGGYYPTLASEVLELQTAFARLGFSQQEIIDMTEPTIQGSFALNSGLEETSLLVGAVVRAYDELGATDTTEIVDKLTKATQRSSLNFDALATALPKVAGAANALNVSLSTTLANLGVAIDATQDASIAGTSYRMVLARNAKANRSLAEGLDIINKSTNKVATAQELYGQRAFVVALALANNIERTKELSKEIDDSLGVSMRSASKIMDTTKGSIEGVASAWERFILTIGKSEGGFFKATLDYVREIINSWTFLIEMGEWDPVRATNKYNKQQEQIAADRKKRFDAELSYIKILYTEREKAFNQYKTEEEAQANLYADRAVQITELEEIIATTESKSIKLQAEGRIAALKGFQEEEELRVKKANAEQTLLDEFAAEQEAARRKDLKAQIAINALKLKANATSAEELLAAEKEILRQKYEYDIIQDGVTNKEKELAHEKYIQGVRMLDKKYRDKNNEANAKAAEIEAELGTTSAEQIFQQKLEAAEITKQAAIENTQLTEGERRRIIAETDSKIAEDWLELQKTKLQASIEADESIALLEATGAEAILQAKKDRLKREMQAKIDNEILTQEQIKQIKAEYELEVQALDEEKKIRDAEAEIESFNAEIEILRAQHQYTLEVELEFLQKKKEAELLNKNLTEKEKQAIEDKYAAASKTLTEKTEKAKATATQKGVGDAIGALGELFGIQQEAAVAQMLIAAPEAIANSFAKAAETYPTPLNLIMGALGAAGTIIPIIKGLNDIRKVRFSKKKGGAPSGGSITPPSAPAASGVGTAAINDVAANNAARLGVDPSLGSNATSDAANNVSGGASSSIVFSESKYKSFQNQVQFKEGKTTI